MAKADLTAQRLRELLQYDPKTGDFIWICRGGKTGPDKTGTVAGSDDGDGYWRIKLDKRTYRASRLAWLYVHGEWPSGWIDHINGIRTDNSIKNLRLVTPLLNQQNQRRAHPRSISGLIGTVRNRNKWRARIRVNGENIGLGTFDTAEEAHAAYIEAKRRLHPGCTI